MLNGKAVTWQSLIGDDLFPFVRALVTLEGFLKRQR